MNSRAITKSWVLLAVILLAGGRAAAVMAESAPAPESITWLTYREAKTQARDQDKPVLIHFTAPWCKWCKEMKKVTYTDKQVIRYLEENFKVAMVDTEKLPSLARKYAVESLPTLWFLDPSGRALTSVAGMVGPEKLLRILEFIGSKAYVETDYDTWLSKRKSR